MVIPPNAGAGFELSTTVRASYASITRRAAIPRAERIETIGRYALKEELGAGSSGVVYRAIDLDRGLPVALKVLHNFDPSQLAAFKSEFRLAAACSDPSLVSVFELIEHDRAWGIAMELVSGPPLLDYLRPSSGAAAARLDEARLRRAFRDIVGGLVALHRAGIVHRDLKPSNLLVSSDERVRIADFGLAKLFDAASLADADGFIVGTPEYMAPEQAMARPVTPAADIYALGVVLFEALTGELPFQGDAVLLDKNLADAPDLGRLAPDAPGDLAALAARLLARDPAKRPTLHELRRHLSDGAAAEHGPSSYGPRELVGRDAELASLLRAFEDDRNNSGPVVVQITGPSGVGKTALLRTLIGALERSRGATVLAGRCHELESIPHKGFDSIVDALSHLLISRAPATLDAELWASLADAARMFPVLEDALPSMLPVPTASASEQARRAREAVPHLLRTLPSLVIAIDDVQWADAEGGWLLESILTASPRCARMVILAYRDSEAGDSPFLRHLGAISGVGTHFAGLTLQLAPLTPDHAQRLALQIIGNDVTARQVAFDSQGEPFLLEQLAMAARAAGINKLKVDDVVLTRAGSCGADGFKLVEVVSVAGSPLPESLATEVAGVVDARRILNELVASSILRRSGAGPSALIYAYHDRIRASVDGSVQIERKRAMQRHIAELGEAKGLLTSATLTRHFEHAGCLDRAAHHAFLAARAAEEALAFEAAAAMYARVIKLSADVATVQEARCAHARVLFVAGRCDEAGESYLAAAQNALDADARALERSAVEAFLAFGHVKRALSILGPLLERERMPYPRTIRSLLFGLARANVEIRLRTRVKPTGRDLVDRRMAARSDLAWSGKGLVNVAPAEGVALTVASVGFALRSGCAFRIARGLGFVGSGFVPGFIGVGARYLEWVKEIAERLDNDHLRTWYQVASASRAFILGDWGGCLRYSQEAINIALATPAPTHWEEAIARTFVCSAYEYLGQFANMEASSREHLKTTRAQGDRITEVMIVSALGYPLAAKHDAAGLDEVIDHMRVRMQDWSVPYPFWQVFRWRLQCLRALCWGDVRSALELVENEWPRLERYRLLDLPVVRQPATCVKAAVLLEAVATGQAEKRPTLAMVSECARVLARAPRAEGPAAAEISRAATAQLLGRPRQRDEYLERAEAIARRGKMGAVERMVRRARAGYRGDTAELRQVEAELVGLGISDPAAWSRFVTPGLCDVR